MTDQELYQEEQRQILLNLDKSINVLSTKLDEQIKLYVAPKDEVTVKGSLEVNTEKQIEVTNLESLQKYFNEVSEQIQKSIESNSYKPLEQIVIKNISDAKQDSIKVTNLKELSERLEPILKGILDKDTSVNVTKQEVIFPTNPKTPIAVRLSDGKSFYNAIMGAFSGGASSSFKDSTGRQQLVQLESGAVPVVTGLVPKVYDTIQVTSYNANNDPLVVVYRSGGASGTIEATLNLTYDGSNNITQVVRS